jgi:hypothetical protein
MSSQCQAMLFAFNGSRSRPSGSSMPVMCPNGLTMSAYASMLPADVGEKR